MIWNPMMVTRRHHEYGKNDENSNGTIASNFKLKVDQSTGVLWRRVNTYCDVTLLIDPRMFLMD